jgi:hypothetical protein
MFVTEDKETLNITNEMNISLYMIIDFAVELLQSKDYDL